jgi:probable HAF family extracellular repeat protein
MPASKRRLLTIVLGLAVVFALLLPYLRPRPAPRYTVTDLGVLPGDTMSEASGINNHGDIVGVSAANSFDGNRIFLYANGRMTSLGRSEFVGYYGGPAINDSGKINRKQRISRAGNPSGYGKNLPHHAILYSGSRKIDFPMPPGWNMVRLCGVNGLGQVVGDCWRQTLGTRRSRAVFVYDSKTQKFSMLPMPPGFIYAEVNGINDHGQVIGWATQANSLAQAVIWNAGQTVLLAPLPGRSESIGAAINNQCDAVGSAGSEPNMLAQFVSDHNIRLQPFVPIFERQWEDHAVVYKGGKAQDLNMLIPEDADWILKQANGINDKGQIVGHGLHHGQERAFLLTPVH